MKVYIAKNGSRVTIRAAQKEDAVKMIEYLHIISAESDYLTFGPGELNITLEREEAIIQESYNSANKLFLVAELDGTIIGNLNFNGGLRSRTLHAGEFGVSVRREYWNLGVGRELIAYLMEWAKQSGTIRKINLRVREDNTRGIALYKKLGFVQEGILTRDFYVNGQFYSSVLMGMEIN